ncbi:DNA cytosine methyltransferase [Staphylococcus chromogenes]|uniref:DNA cytosine methyltransferase n=1 Tax=Staphylococcus chromogenes TaxID=46126 RepID=UPI002DBC5DEC|nr:DNA cytosine methyltransferase [Staphylococcus chromogenes]MEB7825605.1 DNA cytosine methyltransferase [Staphylococcus chromogenes]
MNKLKVCSLFAGVGGIDLAFEQTGNFETIIANEIDAKASETYRLNFNSELIQKDIRDIEPENLPDFDVLLSGFPCTSFSIAGYRKGFEDETSGDLFFETLKVIVEKQPQIVFLENVKNLVGHDNGNTFKVIREALETNGYHIKYQVLNAKDYGNIPQNRERIYIVGFKDIEQYKNFDFPKPINLNQGITDVVDFSKKVDDSFYYTEDKYKFYHLLKESIVKSDTIYQWRRKYVRENKSNVSPTLTANMGTGGHNVPLILSKHGIRKFTPRECFSLQGFPESFKLPDLANSHLYKQAGNSVVVPVVNRIAQNIYRAVNKEVCI